MRFDTKLVQVARIPLLFVFIQLLVLIMLGCQTTKPGSDPQQWEALFDDELTQWEVWMGVPHSTVTGLPSDIFKSDNLNVHGDPRDAMGLGADVKQVFDVKTIEGKPALYISGEIYGGLTTTRSFENYHLSLEVKWGDKKWAPRLHAKRDSGLLFHCRGPHGAFWKVWKACQELQIQESDFGDYIPLAGPSGVIRASNKDGQLQYDPDSEHVEKVKGYSHASSEPDKAHGEWNKVELFALEDKAVFVVNGVVVMVITESRDKQGNPLTSGQIQLQSEGAEVFFRDLKIRSIASLPSTISNQANL